MQSHIFWRAIAMLCLAVSSLQAGSPQQQSQTGPPTQNTDIPQQRTEQKKDKDSDAYQTNDTLKVNVNVVNFFFNVKDKRGALIPDLKKDDFEVYEDGVKQNIKYFSAETNQPLTLGLMIDTSGSQMRVLPMEKEVGAAFLKDVLREKDLAFLISFDIDVELLQDFTNSSRDIRVAMEKTRINTGGATGTGIPGLGGGPLPQTGTPRGTLLYDAIYLAADEKLRQEAGRKALILFTDGEDQGSRTLPKEAIIAAQKSDVICYVIMIADRGFYGGFYGGDHAMRQLADDTGGRVIDVGNKYEKLQAGFKQISDELRSQYSIGYTPTNTKQDGSFRKLEIRTKQGYKIQTRKGYYAGKK